MTKKEEDYTTTPEPSYYQGKKYGYSARKVVEDFDLSYNVGTACSYLMRAGKKDGNPAEQDIQKAINHLHFELDRLYKASDVKTGGLAQ
jgi:hypothetical protein|tara:strand:- start:503 stop:769 length:267 start_codon:yes stop_codon:yes gene_type:complete